MEELFPLIVIVIGVISSIVSANKKEKEKQAEQARREEAAKARAARQQTEREASAKQPDPVPMQPTVVPPAATPAQPQVHVHVETDCAEHDAAGSLGVTSTEGKDPCHEEQMPARPVTVEAPHEEAALQLDFSGDGLARAFIMQEVLNRPVARRGR